MSYQTLLWLWHFPEILKNQAFSQFIVARRWNTRGKLETVHFIVALVTNLSSTQMLFRISYITTNVGPHAVVSAGRLIAALVPNLSNTQKTHSHPGDSRASKHRKNIDITLFKFSWKASHCLRTKLQAFIQDVAPHDEGNNQYITLLASREYPPRDAALFRPKSPPLLSH